MVMKLGADVNYTGETSGGVQSENATESYTVTNARISVSAKDGKWKAMLWGRNITDEYYFPAAYIGGNGPFVRANAMPATYGVTFDYNF